LTIGIEEVLGRIDKEKIYNHVLRLEGSRESLDSPERLDEAANYIRSEFEKHGLSVHEHNFKVEGLDKVFRNIEAATSADDGFLLVSSHYDTVLDCPGADDNASGVAVMLETARVLATEGVSGVRFVSFTLEEQDPVIELRRRDTQRRLGLTNDKQRFTSARTHGTFRLLRKSSEEGLSKGLKLHEVVSETRKKYEGVLDPTELEYLRTLETLYKERETPYPVGSSRWLKEAVLREKPLGVINFDMVGYVSEREHSQALPKGMKPGKPPFDFLTHKVADFSVGNYLVVLGNASSKNLLGAFCDQSKSSLVDIPYAALNLPFPYEFIASNMSDLLRSDHNPFWRAEIPALFVSDGGNFRYPYYHTPADTIDKLDFDFMARVAKATVATVMQLRIGKRVEAAAA
jgi:hypothetical protein